MREYVAPACIDHARVTFGEYGASSISLRTYERDEGEPATVQLSISMYSSGVSNLDVTTTLPVEALVELMAFLERARDRAKAAK